MYGSPFRTTPVPPIAMIEAQAFHNAQDHKAVFKEELRQKPGLRHEIDWAKMEPWESCVKAHRCFR